MFVETENGDFINLAYAARLSSQETRANDPDGRGRVIAEMRDGYTVRLAHFKDKAAADAGLRLLIRQVEKGRAVIPLSYYCGGTKATEGT